MNILKTLSLTFILFLSISIQADTGSFSIRTDDFKQLYNKHRIATPERIPWAGSFWPYGSNGLTNNEGRGSPSEKYDRAFKTQSFRWEMDEHSCKNVGEKYKQGCNDWWGHCNAWAASAIKDPEPRKDVNYQGITFSPGNQKGLITELWMDSSSLFAGNTDKSRETGEWITDVNHPSYRKFWDVSPRTFFLIFTNYVGVMQKSVIIDRYAGDQVWNQPISGYRFLPIRPSDTLKAVTNSRNPSQKLYPVDLRIKIYWANDGVQDEHLSASFNINKTTDSEYIENFPDYSGRLLKFRFYFDAPVVVENNLVKSSGRIVGPGDWDHKINIQNYSIAKMDETHPDFIWAPTRLIESGSRGNKNPYITSNNVNKIIKGQSPQPNPDPNNNDIFKKIKLKITIQSQKQFLRKSILGKTKLRKSYFKQKMNFIFSRAGKSIISIDNSDYDKDTQQISADYHFLSTDQNINGRNVRRILAESGIKVIGVTNLR